MSWPLPQDFNEAVQNPAISFMDLDLNTAQAVVGPSGLPLPRSGNFADVYQMRAANGRDWAVKCFTRPVTGLEQRYRKVDEALKKAGLPFTIGFAFLNQGVMVHGTWHPVVKMEWVDGLQLNQAVRLQAGNPKVLDALVQMWSRLCKRLRDAGIAHADLQHGNVLLVAGSKPGSYSLKLIDYDGMFTPSLANTPSGESGHPNYQHPHRAPKQVYSPDLDRFPHLVIATALKALAVCGTKLWENHDTGDNLLFTEEDFKAPASSVLMRDLWATNDPGLQSLVGHLAIACGKAIPQTPWLDQIAPEGVPVPLTPDQARAAAAALGMPPPAWANVVPVSAAEYGVELVAPPPPPPPSNAFTGLEDSEEEIPVEPRSRRTRDGEPYAKKKSSMVPLAIGGGVLAVVLAVVAAVALSGGKNNDETAQQKQDDDKDKEKLKPPPKKETPKPPDPTPPDPTPPKKEPTVPVKSDEFNFDPAGVPELNKKWEELTTGAAASSRYTRTGEFVVTRETNSKTISVFDAKTGTKLKSFTEGETNTADFVCLPEGKVASWHLDQPFAIVWDPATAKKTDRIPVRAIEGTGPRFFDCSPDGVCAAVGYPTIRNEPGKLTLYHTESNKDLKNLEVKFPKTRFTETHFIVGEADRVHFFKLPTGEAERAVRLPSSQPGSRVLALSADGTVALYSGRGRDVHLAKDDTLLATLPARFVPGGPNHYAISDDGRLVAAISPADRMNGEPMNHLEVIDVAAKKLIGRYVLGQGGVDVGSVAFAPDNSALVIARSGRRVQAIEMPRGVLAVLPKMKDPDPMPKDPPLGGGEGWVERWSRPVKDKRARVWFTSDDKSVVIHDPRSPPWQLDVFDASNGVGRPALTSGKPPGILMEKVSLLEDGRLFAMTGIGEFFEWTFKTGETLEPSIKPAWIPKEGERTPPVVEYAPNGRYVFIGKNAVRTPRPGQPPLAEPAPYRLIEVATGNTVSSGEWEGGRAIFSGDSKWLVVHDLRGRLFRINLASGKPEKAWELTDNNARLTSVTNDGTVAMIEGNLENRLRTLHVVDLTALRVLMAVPPTPFASIGKLSPDGKYCIAGLLRPQPAGQPTAFDLNVYEVATGKRLRQARFDGLGNALSLQIASDLGSFAMIDQQAMKAVVYDFKDGAVAVVPKMKDPDPPVMPPAPKIERAPAPDATAVAKAEMKLQTLFKDDYAKKSPTDRRVFATKLLGLADAEADDPALRYAMYRDARDFAIEISETPLVLRAVDGILLHYALDADALRIEALDKVQKTAGNNTALKNAAEAALAAGENAIAADRFAAAVRYVQIASEAVKRGNLPAAMKEEADALSARVQKGAEAFKPVQQALDDLQKNPGNRDAAYAVGHYRCFRQGRWDEGIKNLAAGAFGDMRTAATLDAAAPRPGPGDVKIADAWWQVSQSAVDTLEKQGAIHRARHWYARSLAGLDGAARMQVESRLALSIGGTDYKPGLLAEFTAKVPAILKDQKARIDSVLDFNAGEFKGTTAAGAATDLSGKWSGVLLAPRGGRFRIAVAATDPVVVRIDGRIVIDTNAKGARRDAMVTLPEKPVNVEVTFKCINTEKHSVRLLWSLPGTDAEELIPPESLLHDKKAESVLGKAP
ncbi:MAG: PA14 domain-containing protein [Gemmataceae bacterium]